MHGYGGLSGSSSGGTVSALSGSDYHESQKQWDWLEEVLNKSSRNDETVSRKIKMELFAPCSKIPLRLFTI